MAKFCSNCGNELAEQAAICPKCGVSTGLQVQSSNDTNSNGIAVAGFVLSFLISLLGLIFSIIGLKKSKETNNGKELIIAGIIISTIINIVIIIIIVVSFVTVNKIIDDVKNETQNEYYSQSYNY